MSCAIQDGERANRRLADQPGESGKAPGEDPGGRTQGERRYASRNTPQRIRSAADRPVPKPGCCTGELTMGIAARGVILQLALLPISRRSSQIAGIA
jgi:hypothetical protein